jgi:O-methyltransferase
MADDELQNRLSELEASSAQAWARAHDLDAEARRAWEHAHTLNALLEQQQAANVALMQQQAYVAAAAYHHDGLAVWAKVAPFMDDARFQNAYAAGMNSGHHIGRPPGSTEDIHIEWRVHVLCWAATRAARLDGDFVECGVNTGVYSLAVCQYVDFNRLDKAFYLFDTYRGLPAGQMHDEERAARTAESEQFYSECYELARSNFAAYPRAHLVRGTVPETLSTVGIDRVAYLSIDMNLALPERAAIEWFWPKLVSGALVILDDYGWEPFSLQRRTMDEFAASVEVEILTLPTGQGILYKT